MVNIQFMLLFKESMCISTQSDELLIPYYCLFLSSNVPKKKHKVKIRKITECNVNNTTG